MRRIPYLLATALLAGTSGCEEIVDRVRNTGLEEEDSTFLSASAGGLILGLQTPGVLRPGEESVIRLSLTNRGDTIPTGLRVDLLVPAWMEPMPPRPGDRAVTMNSSEAGTRFSFGMDDPPLEPGQRQAIEQRIRVPADSPVFDEALPWSRVVLARLVSATGETMTEVESEISLEGAVPADTTGAGAGAGPVDAREQLGPARLGMTAAALRQSTVGARDSSWSSEGMPERGVIVPIPGGGRALAVLSGDTVMRIEVRDSVPRTREGLGVGSTLQQLRAAYGRACAGIGEGYVAVWFPAAPGISYALDAPIREAAAQLRAGADELPGSARVTRWWLRRGTDSCP